MTHHNLKIFTKYFEPIKSGQKTSELRFNDRNYQIGHTITLHEGEMDMGNWMPTGRTISAKISYIDDYAVNDGYVSLSLSNVGMLIV